MVDMRNRKYGKCLWCGKRIDITNHDRDLCKECDANPTIKDRDNAKAGKAYHLKVTDDIFKKLGWG